MKFKIQIITILSILTLIGILSATTIYSGETKIIPLEFEIVNCSISNNSYDFNGLNFSWEGKNIIISTHPLYKPDKFLVNCFVIREGEVVEYHYSKGGGSYRKKDKEVNLTDDINDLRKEVLLKSLLEGQNIDNETIKTETEEDEKNYQEPKFDWIFLIILLCVILIFIIGLIIYSKKINDKK